MTDTRSDRPASATVTATAADSAAAGRRLLVARHELTRMQIVPDPDAPAARPLADGEARLAVSQFALTANNITYAAFGDAMRYWQFFPCGDAEWGCIPVWGFADVVESRAEGVQVGERLYGYLPMGTHLVVQPARVNAEGFLDGSAHRRELPIVYNHLQRCAADPGYDAHREGLQALLRPLFITSFLIDDFLAEHEFFGATQLLLSSASSKTAYGTAFCLAQRRSQPGTPRIVGLSSATHLDFAAGLGCFDEVLAYDAVPALDPTQRTVFVDFAGNAALRRAVHARFDAQLAYSCSVGGTHWQALGGGGGLPGPKPVLFFAPARIEQRRKPPPAGWGADELQRRLALAWRAFIERVDDPVAPWLHVEQGRGEAAVQAALSTLLAGRADPRRGQMLTL